MCVQIDLNGFLYRVEYRLTGDFALMNLIARSEISQLAEHERMRKPLFVSFFSPTFRV